jgi:hypothetical protein
MTRQLLFIILLCFFASCNNEYDDKIKGQVTDIAINYVSGQLKNPQKNVYGNGTIILSDTEKKYSIDPAKIYLGLIDDDDKFDAIITISSFRGANLDLIEHLIVINTNGKFMLIRTVESDMKILQVKDRVITAKVPTRPRTSPLYNCESCQEIVNYRYLNGDLVKIEN